MERRSLHRSSVRLPVDLVWSTKDASLLAAAGIMDISPRGLRVQTGPPLIPGRTLNVFLKSRKGPFAYCRVVWTDTHGSALPSEAGLQILEAGRANGTACPDASSSPGRNDEAA